MSDVLRTAMFGDFQGKASGAPCCVERKKIRTESRSSLYIVWTPLLYLFPFAVCI